MVQCPWTIWYNWITHIHTLTFINTHAIIVLNFGMSVVVPSSNEWLINSAQFFKGKLHALNIVHFRTFFFGIFELGISWNWGTLEIVWTNSFRKCWTPMTNLLTTKLKWRNQHLDIDARSYYWQTKGWLRGPIWSNSIFYTYKRTWNYCAKL